MITDEQLHLWHESGYLILEGFCSDDEIDAVQSSFREAWARAPHEIVVDNLISGRRSRMDQLTDEERDALFFKVNDLYLTFPEVREVVLGERISAILVELLGDSPVLCNTLNLLRSSQQDDHVDSIYMTPRTPHKLVATWMALQDAHPDAGMLRYYEGSHRIPLHTFSDGTYHSIKSEMDDWEAHYKAQIEQLGLAPKTFAARRGDLFIWHGDLLHGGGIVNDPDLTRDSLVSHFYALEDANAQNLNLHSLNSGYWWERPPQEVPGEESKAKAIAKRVLPAGTRRKIKERLGR